MNAIITDNLDRIRELALAFEVERLELIGSAARDDFDPNSSDLDFIVRFRNVAKRPGYGFRVIDFADALAAELGHSVDLLPDKPISNPYLADSIRRDRQVIYEFDDAKAPV